MRPRRADFTLGYSGDSDIIEALLAGGEAWFSVAGGLFPRPCMEIAAAVQGGRPFSAVVSFGALL